MKKGVTVTAFVSKADSGPSSGLHFSGFDIIFSTLRSAAGCLCQLSTARALPHSGTAAAGDSLGWGKPCSLLFLGLVLRWGRRCYLHPLASPEGAGRREGVWLAGWLSLGAGQLGLWGACSGLRPLQAGIGLGAGVSGIRNTMVQTSACCSLLKAVTPGPLPAGNS